MIGRDDPPYSLLECTLEGPSLIFHELDSPFRCTIALAFARCTVLGHGELNILWNRLGQRWPGKGILFLIDLFSMTVFKHLDLCGMTAGASDCILNKG